MPRRTYWREDWRSRLSLRENQSSQARQYGNINAGDVRRASRKPRQYVVLLRKERPA